MGESVGGLTVLSKDTCIMYCIANKRIVNKPVSSCLQIHQGLYSQTFFFSSKFYTKNSVPFERIVFMLKNGPLTSQKSQLTTCHFFKKKRQGASFKSHLILLKAKYATIILK